MTTSISELKGMSQEEALLRSIERIVDAAVLDSKIERAVSVLWVTNAVESCQLSDDEVSSYLMTAMFQEVR